MASDALHLLTFDRARQSARLAPALRALLEEHLDCARLGTILVDLPYLEGFIGRALDDLRRRPDRPCPWGDRLHRDGAVALARNLLVAARTLDEPGPVVALALGHLSHVQLDVSTHAEVNRFVAAEVARGAVNEGKVHRAIENIQAELWHRQQLGRRLFGGPRSFGLLAQRVSPLTSGPVGDAVAAAMKATFGEAPSPRQWRTWGLGLAQYALAIAGPPGWLYLRGAALRAGERWFRGGELDFCALVDATVERMVDDLSAAHALFTSGLLDPGAFHARFPERDLDFPQGANGLQLAR